MSAICGRCGKAPAVVMWGDAGPACQGCADELTADIGNGKPARSVPLTEWLDGEPNRWLLSAADLLSQPDPGPPPMLVEGLIPEREIIACVGRWKTTKSYALLDLCISIVSGEPAFGKFPIIPDRVPGWNRKVVYICEESGKAALWRRLDALCRGRAIDPQRLRNLKVAANARRRLDDPVHQRELTQIVADATDLVVFDPLARMKAPEREENAQTDMAVVVEFLRELREETGSAVAFVHHTGHTGEHMRGSSDLESVWDPSSAVDGHLRLFSGTDLAL